MPVPSAPAAEIGPAGELFYCNETWDDIPLTVRYTNADGDLITFRYAYMETGSAFVISAFADKSVLLHMAENISLVKTEKS